MSTHMTLQVGLLPTNQHGSSVAMLVGMSVLVGLHTNKLGCTGTNVEEGDLKS